MARSHSWTLKVYGITRPGGGFQQATMSASCAQRASGADAARRFSLVGHDWGAALAWRMASALPQRVRRLVAISVGHPGNQSNNQMA